MAIELKSFAEMALVIGEIAIAEVEAQHHALVKAAKLIQNEAKSEIGDYQTGQGPFPSWPELAESTKEEKQRLGYTGQVSTDDPLLRTGEMRDSIKIRVDVDLAHIGSDSDIMVYQEMGTSKIPPRPVLGLAGARSAEKVRDLVGEAAISVFVNGGKTHDL